LGYWGLLAGVYLVFVTHTPSYISTTQFVATVGGCAGAGAAAGLVVVSLRRRRDMALMRAHPDEPWRWDHAWDPTGTSVTALDRFRRGTRPRTWAGARAVYFTAAAVVILFVVSVADGISPGWVMVTAALVVWGWRAWRAHGAGSMRVSYAKFPFHPGERVTLYFGASEGGASFHRVAFHLRHVREVARGPFGWRGAYAASTITVERPPGLLPGPEQDVEIVFDVPARAPGTCLSDALPQYWSLDVVANTSAGPYCESFLVPIYDRPSALPDE
jgi:hypothetical protein